jgi:lysozyme family protein
MKQPNEKEIAIIEYVLHNEGGLADRAKSDDPGGLTNFGITQALYGRTKKNLAGNGWPPLVSQLTREQAIQWYYEILLRDSQVQLIPFEHRRIAGYIFDMIVHHGQKNAVQLLQIALALPVKDVDGIWGWGTNRCLEIQLKTSAPYFLSTLQAVRYTYLWTRPHAKANPGWFTRVLRS